jgi:hypothetical protein
MNGSTADIGGPLARTSNEVQSSTTPSIDDTEERSPTESPS